MHEPLPHYFINSSHNTYCTGELKCVCRTNIKIYSLCEGSFQVLLSGCRCVELDCWDGSDGPVVTHGPSAVMRMNEIPLKAVCSAIAECAFKTSPYPVVLSIENHLCQQQQKEMVQIFREAFGSKLLVDPLESHPVWCLSSRKKSVQNFLYLFLIYFETSLQTLLLWFVLTPVHAFAIRFFPSLSSSMLVILFEHGAGCVSHGVICKIKQLQLRVQLCNLCYEQVRPTCRWPSLWTSASFRSPLYSFMTDPSMIRYRCAFS
ncbi:unnamed protein product [Angiostrongylus costaricensis]|uniref:PLCXc domain-containing protein n=1 Tax=Angiostrongylus costaricensis TaxID=334426 RepID=A0A158PDD7_ANGCS|nr:unnamed protein product [Angiostrongylus costaricensis]